MADPLFRALGGHSACFRGASEQLAAPVRGAAGTTMRRPTLGAAAVPTTLALRHVPFEDLGIARARCSRERGHTVRYVEVPDRRASPPSTPLEPDLLVVLGGPIGVYETDRYPFLDREIELARRSGCAPAARRSASASAASSWRKRSARASIRRASRRSAGRRSTLTPDGRDVVPAPPRRHAGAALARRHVRLAGRRRAPRVDAGLPQPGVHARRHTRSRCNSTPKPPGARSKRGSSATRAEIAATPGMSVAAAARRPRARYSPALVERGDRLLRASG